jgi:hypothetical protein
MDRGLIRAPASVFVFLFGVGMLAIRAEPWPPGQWISAGSVSLVVFAAFAHLLWRALTGWVPSTVP